MNVDVASFFFLGGGRVLVCSAERESQKRVTQSWTCPYMTTAGLKPLVPPAPKMLHAVVDKWCHFSFQTGGVDALERQGGVSDGI